MSSSKPTAAGWRRWLSTGTGTLWRILAFALLVAIVLVVLRARQATNAPPLEPWHTLAAIEARDPEAARAALTADIQGASDFILSQGRLPE